MKIIYLWGWKKNRRGPSLSKLNKRNEQTQKNEGGIFRNPHSFIFPIHYRKHPLQIKSKERIDTLLGILRKMDSINTKPLQFLHNSVPFVLKCFITFVQYYKIEWNSFGILWSLLGVSKVSSALGISMNNYESIWL